jgi:hypothetical protein
LSTLSGKVAFVTGLHEDLGGLMPFTQEKADEENALDT